MGCKFGSSVVLLSDGCQNFQPHIRTQNFLEYPSPGEGPFSCCTKTTSLMSLIHPEDQIEEDNEEKLKQNGRK